MNQWESAYGEHLHVEETEVKAVDELYRCFDFLAVYFKTSEGF